VFDNGDSFKISSIKLPENVTPTIRGRDFVIATLAAPTIIKEPEKPAEETTEGAEGAEGAGAEGAEGAEGETKTAAEGDKKEDDKEKKDSNKKAPEKKETPKEKK
jgi:large subunit ribosomal protein L25